MQSTVSRGPRAVQQAVEIEPRFAQFKLLFDKLDDNDLAFLRREDVLALDPNMAPGERALLLVMFNKYLAEEFPVLARPLSATKDVSIPVPTTRAHPGFLTDLHEREFNPATDQGAKNALQEYCAKRHLALPVYTVLAKTGMEHMPRHSVQCTADSATATGTAVSRIDADKAAAAAVLALLGQ